MEVRVAQEVLQKALSQVSRIVTSKPSYPILSNILIETTKSGLMTLTSTNLDITLSVSCGVESKTEGRLTAPAKMLSDFVGFLPRGEVLLKSEKDKLRVSSEKHDAVFSIISPEEFPEIPSLTEGQEPLITVEASVIKPVLDKVTFACSRDASRPVFSAVYVEPSKDSNVYLVGVDGFRLSRVIIEAKVKEGTSPLMIPADAMEEVSRSLGDDDKLNIYEVKKGHHIVMKYGTVTIAAREIEGTFPDYKAVLPKEEKTKLILSNEEFLNAVKVARLFTIDNIANRVELDFDGKRFFVRSSGGEIGENKTEVEIKNAEGEPFNAAFNAMFLTDVLSRVTTENVVFSTFSPATDEKLNGGIVKEENNDNFLHIVMPLAAK